VIDKTRILDVVEQRLARLPEGHYLELRTYKRNRAVLIIKRSDGAVTVLEDGYEKERFETDTRKLKKLLKVLLRREFPRSHKVRLYEMGAYEEEQALSTPRKVL
jgi:hypothetical protein